MTRAYHGPRGDVAHPPSQADPPRVTASQGERGAPGRVPSGRAGRHLLNVTVARFGVTVRAPPFLSQ